MVTCLFILGSPEDNILYFKWSKYRLCLHYKGSSNLFASINIYLFLKFSNSFRCMY